ncbi:MAG: hypothetical protein PHP17_05120 [Candidatus Omnitrophica bacterium]|nr:hypothetical protein [Candidatus Omnitrophota bacterium]
MFYKTAICFVLFFPVFFNPSIFSKENNPANVNDTAENVFKDFPRQKCSLDSDCKGVFGSIEGKCVKCPGMKMILGKRVFESPKDFGFCEQKHMVDINLMRHPKDEIRDGWGSTCHCLSEYEGKEFITASADIKQYLDIWKEFVISSQKISEGYFNKHITLIKAYESQNIYGTFFVVDYEYKVSWAKVFLCDNFIIKKKDSAKYLSKDEIYSIPAPDGGLKERVFLSSACDNVKRMKEINTIIAKEEAEKTLRLECFSAMKESEVLLTNEGKLALQGSAIVSEKDNKCKWASVDLETGKLLDCRDTACFIE